MKQEKEKLEELLSVKLSSLRTKKKKEDIINVFIQELEQYINKGKLIQYIMLNLPLCSATISELYQITRIGNMYFLFEIHASDWFTDTEMSKAIDDKIFDLTGSCNKLTGFDLFIHKDNKNDNKKEIE